MDPYHLLNELLQPVRTDELVHCITCGRDSRLEPIVMVDWRLRAALEEATTAAESLFCPACGAKVKRQTPLVLLRPGDPFAVLVVLSSAGDAGGQIAQAASWIRSHGGVAALAAKGTVSGIAAADCHLVASRYTGFDLIRVATAKLRDAAGERSDLAEG